jgi:hypothetical protein
MENADWPMWAVALQESAFGTFIRQSVWLYPFGNVIHVLGVALLIGSIVALDARLIGYGMRYVTVEGASKLLTPFAVAGILLLVPGGIVLFVADAGPLAANGLLQLKFALIALGLVNAALFRRNWNARLAIWDVDPPRAGRLQAFASILIWAAVATAGRLIAYF